MKTKLSKKQRKQAKKLFAKKSHTTRPFTAADYEALSKDK
jgi:hypothetical protein